MRLFFHRPRFFPIFVFFTWHLALATPFGLNTRWQEICSNGFAKLGPKKYDHVTLAIDAIAKNPIVNRWLTLQQDTLRSKMKHRIGSILKVSGASYKVVALLGYGSEGEVYIVQTAQGPAVLKSFFKHAKMEENLAKLHTNNYINKAPGILSADLKNRNILTEYIEGVPLMDISKHWQSIGLAETEAKEITSRFDEMIAARTSYPGMPNYDNVIYSFELKDFVLIDPH